MTSKIKNIIIIVAIVLALILIYVWVTGSSSDQSNLISSSGTSLPGIDDSATGAGVVNGSSVAAKDAENFLTLLLNVKNVKMDVSIFTDSAFASLRDSSIILTPDGTEGRPNPFAPLGKDNVVAPANNTDANAANGATNPAPSVPALPEIPD